MLEQQVKETSRRENPASESVDETLSVVRQMMAQQASEAPAAERQSVVLPAMHAARPGVQPAGASMEQKHLNRTIKGRAALPELEVPEPEPLLRRMKSEAPTMEPQARRGVLSRVGALLRRQRRTDEDEGAPQTLMEASEPQHFPETEQAVQGQRTLLQAIKEFRPSRKQIAFVAFVGIMLWRPWLIPGVVFVAFWVGLIAYLSLGPDRVSEIAQSRWDWFRARHPERAERVTIWAQNRADKIDGWLARLPERWTDGIYLPDLGRSATGAQSLEEKPDPFERLAAEQQTMVARRAGGSA